MHPITRERLIGDGVWLHHWEDIPSDYRGDQPRVRFIRLKEEATLDDFRRGLLEFRDMLHEKMGVRGLENL